MAGDVIVKDGYMYGGWREPINIWTGIPGSIHSDEVAQKVGMRGGTIKIGVPYRASGKIVCVGASPKTEYFWYDAYLDEKESGKRVAEMRKMTRFMKASSPLYQDG